MHHAFQNQKSLKENKQNPHNFTISYKQKSVQFAFTVCISIKGLKGVFIITINEHKQTPFLNTGVSENPGGWGEADDEELVNSKQGCSLRP